MMYRYFDNDEIHNKQEVLEHIRGAGIMLMMITAFL